MNWGLIKSFCSCDKWSSGLSRIRWTIVSLETRQGNILLIRGNRGSGTKSGGGGMHTCDGSVTLSVTTSSLVYLMKRWCSSSSCIFHIRSRLSWSKNWKNLTERLRSEPNNPQTYSTKKCNCEWELCEWASSPPLGGGAAVLLGSPPQVHQQPVLQGVDGFVCVEAREASLALRLSFRVNRRQRQQVVLVTEAPDCPHVQKRPVRRHLRTEEETEGSRWTCV